MALIPLPVAFGLGIPRVRALLDTYATPEENAAILALPRSKLSQINGRLIQTARAGVEGTDAIYHLRRDHREIWPIYRRANPAAQRIANEEARPRRETLEEDDALELPDLEGEGRCRGGMDENPRRRRGAMDDDDERPSAEDLVEMAHAAFVTYTETAQGRRGLALFDRIVPYLTEEDAATIVALPWDRRTEIVRILAMVANPSTNEEGLRLLHQNFGFLERPLYEMIEEENKKAAPAASGGMRGCGRHPTAEVRAALNDAFGRASLAVWDDLKDHMTAEEDAAHDSKTEAQFIHMVGMLGPLNPDFPIAVTPALRGNALGNISHHYPMLLRALRRRGWLEGDPRTRPSTPVREISEEGDYGRGRLHGHLMGSGLGKYATSLRMCGCGPMGDPIKPFFCRIGNKYNLRNKIVPMIPDHTTYVEPFVGSAAIFFSKPKAAKNVLNDLDKDTVEGLRLLKQAPLELTAYPEATSLSAAKALFTKPARTVGQKIAHKLIRACNGFTGVIVNRPSQIYNAYSIHRKVKHMATYKDKLSGVKLLNQDYRSVIRSTDSPSTFFFIDPPYENSAKDFGYAEHKGFDFEALLSTLKSIKGKFLMTMNDSPRIRQLFKDFKQKAFSVGTHMGGPDGAKEPMSYRKELFISNY